MSADNIHDSLGVVITGGSAGLGYALAAEFLVRGDRVVICSRNRSRLEAALSSLRHAVPKGEVHGIVCDVGDPQGGSILGGFASERLGRIDRWINNAGTAGQLKRPLWKLQADDILETCTTNLTGSILLCAEAVRRMERQPPSPEPRYHLFNMGFSALGAAFSRSAVPHKASKRGVGELRGFLCRELKDAGLHSIGVHDLSPGLVSTDLLLRDAPPESLRVLDVIAESPERVASVLVPKIRSVSGTGRKLRYQPFVITLLRVFVRLPKLVGKEHPRNPR